MLGSAKQIDKKMRLLELQDLVKKAGLYSKFMADKLGPRQDYFEEPSSKRFKVDVSSSLYQNDKTVSSRQPKSVTGCILRDYQLIGFEWLVSLYENGLNGILADEMGLGKTLQTISFLAYLAEVGTKGPFLIVAPLSTLANWESEFRQFCPSLSVLLYHGSTTERAKKRRNDLKIKNGLINVSVVITSYEISMKDKRSLKSVQWKYIVVDEGHRLKNIDCKLIRDLKSYQSANRLLLTGTPLQVRVYFKLE
jgi:ATP-dependent DNA helicase